jgi:CubicO group peptidase (beta-lactamase class C family)
VSQEMRQAIENGLRSANTIKGKAVPAMNLAERMKRYSVPGVSIAVIDQAEIQWAQGYGVQQAGEDIPVTPQTRFQAASISKPVSAMAALHLAQIGQLDLDQNVNEVLRSWKVPENEHTHRHKVTLRGLLSHTAGLTVHGFPGYASNAEVPTLRQILDGEPPANTAAIRVDCEPGSQWRYSGGGYTVLQQLLEDVTGTPFPEFMRSTVLEPLQMDHSTFEQPLPGAYAEQAASAHGSDGQPIEGKWHTYPEMAAAGLWTTPSDLACFAIEILRSSSGQSNKLLSVEFTREMLKPRLGDFGLGLKVKKLDRSIQFDHAGGNRGFRCFLVANTGTEQGAVVMTNGDNADLLMMEIIRSIAHAYGWQEFQPTERSIARIDPTTLNQYEGEYQFVDVPDWRAVIKREDEHLLLQTFPDAMCYELHPESETDYFSVELEGPIVFVKDEDGTVNTFIIDSQWKVKRVK